MTRKRSSPDQRTREIVVLRSAGWSLAAIADRTGVSVSTVQRALKAHPTPKGAAIQEAVTQAKKELTEAYRGDEALQQLYGELVADSVSHIRRSREVAAAALEFLIPSDVDTAAVTLRGLTSHSTMVKAHCDTLRSIAPDMMKKSDDELPTLVIKAMSREDVERLRREQAEDADELLGIGDDSGDDEG